MVLELCFLVKWKINKNRSKIGIVSLDMDENTDVTLNYCLNRL